MKREPNVLKVNLGEYKHYWRGVKKIGKTTMYRDLLRVAYGDCKYGFHISIGNETGAKAIAGIYTQEAPDWESFVEIIDDLVENKQDNEFKLVALDTVDELVSIAIDKTLKVHFQRKGEKALSLNAALGGYGAGKKYLIKLINDQIKRLESAGYGLVFIGHTKIRDVKEKNMEEGYQQLTSNLESDYDGIFTDKADIIASFYNSKDVKDKTLIGTQRYIYFRNDGFVDAGSRFPDMPERIEMSAENYLKAFEQGVISAFETPIDSKELAKMKKRELEQREESSKKYIEKAKTGSVENADSLKTPEDYIKLIDQEIASLDKESKRQKQEELQNQDIPTKYKEITDIEVLKKILKVVSND